MASLPPELMDLTKMFKSFDPSKMAEEMTKMLGQYKIPGVDMDSIVASQKKNVEALVNANRTVVEGVQAVMKRQAEIVQEAMAEMTKAAGTLGKAGSSPQDLVAAQVDLVKGGLERTFASLQEISQMVAKSQTDATSQINSRVTASLDEFKQLVQKAK